MKFIALFHKSKDDSKNVLKELPENINPESFIIKLQQAKDAANYPLLIYIDSMVGATYYKFQKFTSEYVKDAPCNNWQAILKVKFGKTVNSKQDHIEAIIKEQLEDIFGHDSLYAITVKNKKYSAKIKHYVFEWEPISEAELNGGVFNNEYDENDLLIPEVTDFEIFRDSLKETFGNKLIDFVWDGKEIIVTIQI